MSRMVIALGGNALGETPTKQIESIANTSESIVDLIEDNHEIVLTHGNGPQVGMINLAFEISSKINEVIPEMPFPECGAMSQGYIGYHLQNSLHEEMLNRKINKSISTIITQIIVDENDEAFSNPTKPVGSFYNKKEAKKIEKLNGYTMINDSGRGYRRVVPSPKPIDIVEKKFIKMILKEQQVVITCGGGGIPVIKQKNMLKGVPAVIDKDFASEKLAELINADLLIILTAVDKVALNFGTKNEILLDRININDAEEYCNEGHFASGSMLPKIQAAITFAKSKKGRKTLITSTNSVNESLKGNGGTYIY